MAQIAIKGHPTKGAKVIEILRMLGGINTLNCAGLNEDSFYYIGELEIICRCCMTHNRMVFTLEEFIEKFPYKVGDRVIHNKDIELEVAKMYWDDKFNIVRYDAQGLVNKNFTLKGLMTCHLQPYKETMEERENSVVVNIEHRQLKVNSLRFDKTQLVINDGYELKQEGDTYYIVHKQSKYPKTYEECCMILQDACMTHKGGYKCDLIQAFQKLLICRDAYWVIAGKELGLGTPWRPDWESASTTKYTISQVKNKIRLLKAHEYHYILSFPTEEMRDTFYENFKDLIEACKELL